MKCYHQLITEYHEIDREMAEMDGRKTICEPFKGKSKKEKKELTNVQELIKNMSKEDKQGIVAELQMISKTLGK